MKLSAFSDYTLRVLMYLAIERDRLVTIPEIAVACRSAPVCRLTAILVSAFESLYARLDEYTLADLVNEPRKLDALLLRMLA